MRFIFTLAFAAFLLTTAASAGPAADQLPEILEFGNLSAGAAQLSADDAETKADARVAEISHRHRASGAVVSQTRPRNQQWRAMMNLPVLRIPVPPNPKPEPLDYAKFRAILETLTADLDAAQNDLGSVGDAEIKLPVDLFRIRFDLDGDGKSAGYEGLGPILAALSGISPETGPARVFPIAFDTADFYWMQGYANFIGAFAEFLLAHDFETTFNKTFHINFPNAGLPLAEKLARPDPADRWSGGAVGDAIAMLHLINWKVTDPEKLKNVRTRLKSMAELSRKSWAAARKETDNDHEWLPNAKQTPAAANMEVTDEQIDGWLAVMAEFEAVLDGKKLLPHWRFSQGLNVKRMFEESKNFDLVLLVAGTDAIQWLEPGPVSDETTWNNMMGAFRGNFLGYAVWFN
ncbi:MAG: hypothetical protein HC855_11330 [Rhizobiales bacterium]|nr:hypothetical protein [Hyphomicrobiales bacterium]